MCILPSSKYGDFWLINQDGNSNDARLKASKQ